ncbi:MAG: hypothetical protein ABJQ39_10265 [Winogradskyella arenosi]
MRPLIILVLFYCLSCNNERTLLLPEIENAEVTEVLDVSPAYIFYDETLPDSTLLNRKNLISTTNWLINVDKRLTLNQAIPKIVLMQNKKRNAKMHKNEAAKNYFTCNDTSIENLGFLEFTDVYYEFTEATDPSTTIALIPQETNKDSILSNYHLQLPIQINNFNKFKIVDEVTEMINGTHSYSEVKRVTEFSIQLYFDKNLSFQDYISVKSHLQRIELNQFNISSTEYVY